MWAFAAQGVVAITGLAAMTISARVLGPDDFGLYFTAFTCASLLGIALDSCVAQAILTKSPGYDSQWRYWRGIAILIAVTGALAGAVVATLFVDNPQLLAASWLLALSIPTTIAGLVPRARLLLYGDVRKVAVVDSFSAALANGAVVAMTISTGGIVGVAAGAVIISGLRLSLLQFSRVRTESVAGRPEGGFVLADLRAYWKEMSGTYQSQLVGFLSRTADNLAVSVILGPVSLAQYSRAFSFVIGPTQQAQMALTPTATRDLSSPDSPFTERILLARIATRLIILLLPAVVVVSLSGPTVVAVLLGPGWTTAGGLMMLSVGLAISTVLSTPARWVILARRKNRALRIDSYMQMASLASVAIGAALGGLETAMAATSLIVAPISTFILWRLVGGVLNKLFLTKLLPLALCVTLTAALGAIGVSNLTPEEPLRFTYMMVLILIITLSYGLAYELRPGRHMRG